MKLLVRLAVVLLVLGLLAFGGVFLFFDAIVKGAVERGGTYAAGVPVTLKKVDAALMSGSFGFQGLAIANPEGFRPEPFLSLSEAHAAWPNGSVLSEAIVIDEFQISGVALNLERNDRRSNFGVILESLTRHGGADAEAPPTSAPEASKGGQRSLTIKRIVVRDVTAACHLTALGGAVPSASVHVPEVVIEDFRSTGTTTEIVGKLTSAVVQAILESSSKAGGGVFPAEIGKELRGQVDAAKARAQQTLKDAVRDIGGAVDSVQDGLKGLLKKPK